MRLCRFCAHIIHIQHVLYLPERALAAMSAALAAPQEAVQSPVFVPFELYLPTKI